MKKKKTEFQFHTSRMAKLEHKLKVAEEKRQKRKRAQNQGYDY